MLVLLTITTIQQAGTTHGSRRLTLPLWLSAKLLLTPTRTATHPPCPLLLQVLPVALIFVTAQTLFTVSLANTSVTSNTILSSSASMWTLLTSALVLRERVTAIKLLSVVAVMAGDYGSGEDEPGGSLGVPQCG